jgi:hypothetical protein
MYLLGLSGTNTFEIPLQKQKSSHPFLSVKNEQHACALKNTKDIS